jgi:hypothetical protein
MLRKLLCVGLAIVVCVSAGLADENDGKGKKGKGKRGKMAFGKIVKVDAAGGKLTVNVRSRGSKEGTDKVFNVTDTTKVTSTDKNGKKTDLTGKDVLKKEQFKTGASVRIALNDDGTVKEIIFGGGRFGGGKGKDKGKGKPKE